MLRSRFVLVLCFALFLCDLGRADTVTHFGDGPFADVSVLLDAVGIGSGNVAAETTAEVFFVSGPAGGTSDITFTFQRDTGGFLFTFGFYPIASVTADPITSKVDYAIQAITAGTLVFDDTPDDPGAVSAAFTVDNNTALGFFLIPNDTPVNFLADPAAYYDPPANSGDIFLNNRSPLFSVSDANPGELDQMLSFADAGVTLFTFEDLTRIPGGASDQDFTDLGFTVDAELNNTPPDCSGATLSLQSCWPPNHKFVLLEVEGVTDADGDEVVVTITGITQDEPVRSTGRGSGATCPDAVLVDLDEDEVADAAGVRCERDGTGNGRVYVVSFLATDPSGAECSGSATFCVPHDRSPRSAECVDDGQDHDSTVCPADGGVASFQIVSFEEFETLTPRPLFLRGDVNWDEDRDLSDGIKILDYLFRSGEPIHCLDAADVNDDGEVDLSDAVRLFDVLFLGGAPMPPPVGFVDVDPTDDDLLDCE